eukprot:10846579-Prorocentrum_lima.AAC.1
MQAIDKGARWSDTICHITRATNEIIEERNQAAASGSALGKSQKRFKLNVLKTARSLATTFLDELKNGDGHVFEAFANAGARFKLTDLAFDDMEAKYDTFLADPSKENLDLLGEKRQRNSLSARLSTRL